MTSPTDRERASRGSGETYAVDILQDEGVRALLKSPEVIELRELSELSIRLEQLLDCAPDAALRQQRVRSLEAEAFKILGLTDDELAEGERAIDEQLDQVLRDYDNEEAHALTERNVWPPRRGR